MSSDKSTKTASSQPPDEEDGEMVKYAVSPEGLTKEATLGVEDRDDKRGGKAKKKD